ncbi:SusE domain-containing protein [Niabella aquatica]
MSCKKEGSLNYAATPETGATLSSSKAGPLALALETQDDTATVFNWNKVSYETDVPVTYTLQYDSVGKNFSSPVDVVLGASTSVGITQSMLNGYGIKSGIAADASGGLEFRIKSAIGLKGVLPSYSNVIKLLFNTYGSIAYWYVPGDYQGWNPSAAPRLGSSDLDNYQGYIWVPSGNSGEFKITSHPNWDHTNYGGTSTKLDPSGPNLVWPAVGKHYLVTASLSKLTWSATTINTWGVIGNATPGGWDNSTPMTYDPATGKWKATVTFTAGEFKFRANNNWDLSLGSGPSGYLTSDNGGNLSITGGTKTIYLDLREPLKYSYTIE